MSQLVDPAFIVQIKSEALRLGFLDCAFTDTSIPEFSKQNYSNWIMAGCHAGMDYLTRNTEKRFDPSLLVEGTNSIMVLLYNYYAPDKLEGLPYQIARYAYGQDYHDVVKAKLGELSQFIAQTYPGSQFRSFVDSAPVMERSLAAKSGMGWIGRNSCLINRRHGSFFFIAELFTSLIIPATNAPASNYCGNCRRCVDACPTMAISEQGHIDSNLCISYHTIENKGDIPEHLHDTFKNYIFGCDICQLVCPWNAKVKPNQERLFEIDLDVVELASHGLQNFDEQSFKSRFSKSALSRTKFSGIARNINFVNSDLKGEVT